MAETKTSGAAVHLELGMGSPGSDAPGNHKENADNIDLVHVGEDQGYILDESTLKQRMHLDASVAMKKTPDGILLIPQPTDDPRDPLNWPRRKKLVILMVIAVASCTADYAAATGASAIVPQAEQWHLSPARVNHATAGNTFMLGAGGIVTVALSAYIGRLPVLFWFSLMGSATAAWAAGAGSFYSYLVARVMNGFFAVAAAAGGLMWINDMFFFHERPRAVNAWAFALILSPFIGPCFMAAILTVQTWRVGMWLNFGFITLSLVLVVLFAEETFYPRHCSPDQIADIKKRSRILRLVGFAQFRTQYTTNSLWEACLRPLSTLAKPAVLLTNVFYFFDFGWVIANNTTISVFVLPEYNYGFKQLALIYTAPIIGAIMSLVVGHKIFDIIGRIYARRNNGMMDAEARLVPIWLVFPLQIVGYMLIGASLEYRWNIYVLAVGWGLHNFALILSTAAVSSYLTDAYPEASGESAALLNFSRTLSGFILGYVQIEWVRAQGPLLQYGISCAIMGGAFVIFFVPLQFAGPWIRRRSGRLQFKTN